MGNCKDCIHWAEGDKEDYSKLIGAGVCKRAKQFWDSTEWETVIDEEGCEPDEIIRSAKSKDDLMFVQDGSDYHAELITLPDFGCVQFENKSIGIVEDYFKPSKGMNYEIVNPIEGVSITKDGIITIKRDSPALNCAVKVNNK